MRFWRKKPAETSDQLPADSATAVAEAELGGRESSSQEEWTAAEQEEIREQTERAVERSRRGLFGRIGGIFQRSDFDEDLWEELEELLVASDTGLVTTERILRDVRQRVKDEGVKQASEVRAILREELITILDAPYEFEPY